MRDFETGSLARTLSERASLHDSMSSKPAAASGAKVGAAIKDLDGSDSDAVPSDDRSIDAGEDDDEEQVGRDGLVHRRTGGTSGGDESTSATSAEGAMELLGEMDAAALRTGVRSANPEEIRGTDSGKLLEAANGGEEQEVPVFTMDDAEEEGGQESRGRSKSKSKKHRKGGKGEGEGASSTPSSRSDKRKKKSSKRSQKSSVRKSQVAPE